ncbi:MAG: carbon starvation protein A [bacterium]|nr:carbon starvation protein A [bacterium]
MNIAIILIISLFIFWLGYRYYARYICRVFGEDNNCPTPAVAYEDGIDYVPTKPIVIFGHHFASIAGAGPIIGPAIGLVYGWIPCLLWIVIGTVVIGGVHDLSALMTSVREKGKSVAELARDTLGPVGFFLIIAYTLLIVLLVCAAFLNATATALTSMYPLSDMQLGANQTVFRTVITNGTSMAVVGGIASTQAIAITCIAPIIGLLLYRLKFNAYLVSLIAIIAVTGCVILGIAFPLTLSPDKWKIIISIYTLIAAGVPVWIVLQPRDFTNAFILYAGIVLLVIGVFVGGLRGVPMQLASASIALGESKQGPIYPMLLILIACGAISGFHALVAGGTSSKQVSLESHIKPVSYGGMVLEGILAVGVVIAIAVGLNHENYMTIMYPALESAKQNPILAFAIGMGSLLNRSLGFPIYFGVIFGVVMVEGFIATTLDTAVRLNRYLFEELWSVMFKNPPKIMKTYLFNAALAVVFMYFLAKSNALNKIWPIFGAGNQLLAALTLIAVSVWLLERKKPAWFAIIPGVFMLVTTMIALVYVLTTSYWPTHNVTLIVADILLLALAVGTVVITIIDLRKQALAPPKRINAA